MRWLVSLFVLLFGVASSLAETPSLEEQALALSEAAIGNQLPRVQLTDSEGRPVQLTSLGRKPLLVAMIYTGCTDVCPTILESLKPAVEIAQEALGKDSFTVATIGFDSRNDTPDRMRLFARDRGIDVENWLFLAGTHSGVSKLADATGFSIVPSAGGFDHMAQVSIFDADGRLYQQVRGSIFSPPDKNFPPVLRAMSTI